MTEYIETIIDGYKIIDYKPHNIFVIENIVDEIFCKKYIDYINNSKLKNTEKDENYKTIKCDFIELDIQDDNNITYDYEIYSIFHKIFKIIKKYNNYININGDTKYILRKIYGKTDCHIDEVRAIDNIYFFNQIRSLSTILNLNDNYDGGEFNFPIQNINHKLKEGSVILFPPFWTHPHEVSNVGIDQYRYTITTWGTENIV